MALETKMLSAGGGNRKVDLRRKDMPADNFLYFLDQKESNKNDSAKNR